MHGSYAVDACARTRYVYFSKTNRGRWKVNLTATKNNEHSPPYGRGNLMSTGRRLSGLTCFDSFC